MKKIKKKIQNKEKKTSKQRYLLVTGHHLSYRILVHLFDNSAKGNRALSHKHSARTHTPSPHAEFAYRPRPSPEAKNLIGSRTVLVSQSINSRETYLYI